MAPSLQTDLFGRHTGTIEGFWTFGRLESKVCYFVVCKRWIM